MKIILLLMLTSFVSSCGKMDTPVTKVVEVAPQSEEGETLAYFMSRLKANSILVYDFNELEADFINVNSSNLLGPLDDKTLSLNQNGANNQYVQTSVDAAMYADLSISLWFKTEDITAIQTLIWQGVGTQNGWGNSANNPALCEFHVNLNHFANFTGQALAAFYGYNDLNTDPLEQAVNFPYAPSGTVTGNLVTLTTDWHHLVVVLNQRFSQVTLSTYLDGVFVDSHSGTQVDNSLWNIPLRIGRPGVDTRKFRGEIDSLLIIDRVLNNTEIQKIHQFGREI